MTRFLKTSLIPLVAALVLAGCASTSTFVPTAAPAAPVAFKEDRSEEHTSELQSRP